MTRQQNLTFTGMAETLRQMIERADERQLKVVYIFISKLMGGKKA